MIICSLRGGRRFSQPIRKLIRQCGEVSSELSFQTKGIKGKTSGCRQLFDGNPHLIYLQLTFLYFICLEPRRVALSPHTERNLALIHTCLRSVFESSHTLWVSDQRHAKSLGLQTKLPIWKKLRRRAVMAGYTAVENELVYGVRKRLTNG